MIMKELNNVVTRCWVLSDVWFRNLKIKFWGLKIKFKYLSGKLLLFFENYITSGGAGSHNVLYYQQLSIDRYTASFYANSDDQ